MVGVLNLYLDEQLNYGWREVSFIVAKSQGHGKNHAWILRTWILRYLKQNKLPLHYYGQWSTSVLNHEDIAQAIQLQLLEKASSGYLCAQDVVDVVATPAIQEMLKHGATQTSISHCTAQRWLHKLDWQYKQDVNGMYVDGHEHEDVVQYQEAFVRRWMEYEKRMVTYNHDGNISSAPHGTIIPNSHFQLYLITHDKSTFYTNDWHKTKWVHLSQKATPQQKGEGALLIVSDFLTSDWGPLKHEDQYVCTNFALNLADHPIGLHN
ncbi:hypothetical protein WOLCODRAFT_78099 [Wolfiporia cocos MD-104 SS10]|uniref:Uncharacterized protein n=1 Tax=Wolfiporia cocos (strain MD-104) TaxID=742152 RepID=A0A2H3K8C7_WOLCO|nr:hypothetical protein WOLCODRAFT_78099 [Wolfiporia cocos MD-104 SS10]